MALKKGYDVDENLVISIGAINMARGKGEREKCNIRSVTVRVTVVTLF